MVSDVHVAIRERLGGTNQYFLLKQMVDREMQQVVKMYVLGPPFAYVCK